MFETPAASDWKSLSKALECRAISCGKWAPGYLTLNGAIVGYWRRIDCVGAFQLGVAERDRTDAFHEVYGREILKLDIEPLPERTLQVDMNLRALPGMSVAMATVSPIVCRHTKSMIDNVDPVIVLNLEGTANGRFRSLSNGCRDEA
ncbi:hypothetical protein [Bradyrhizobium sp. USDA 4486]